MVEGRTESVMVLPLRKPCEHCGDELAVYLRRVFPSGNLQAAVSHAIVDKYHTGQLDWRDIKGFEDTLRITSGTEGI